MCMHNNAHDESYKKLYHTVHASSHPPTLTEKKATVGFTY